MQVSETTHFDYRFGVGTDISKSNVQTNSRYCTLFLSTTPPFYWWYFGVSHTDWFHYRFINWSNQLLYQLATSYFFTVLYILYHLEVFTHFINVLIKYWYVFLPEIVVRSTRGITLFIRYDTFFLIEMFSNLMMRSIHWSAESMVISARGMILFYCPLYPIIIPHIYKFYKQLFLLLIRYWFWYW